MRLRDPAVYLEDIERHAEAAIRFARGLDTAQYLADDKTRAAVERSLEICGEALRQLQKAAPELAAQVPQARAIIGFRNILAHGYAEIDHFKVYSVLTTDAPALLETVRRLLAAFPAPDSAD
jgi:uncharacterized protein with HEPN domain